jgi:sulfopyruvate decarboxylase subunit alpha
VSWQADLAGALAGAGVEAAAWVPDKRLDPIARALAAGGMPLRTLTREEECVAWASGYRAVGGSPAVLFQCSGLGNALNALGSLAIPYGYGFPMVLSMRGSLGERNPSQLPLGQATPALLRSLGLEPFSLRRPEDAGVVARGALDVADGARRVAPIILEAELDLR